MTSCEKHFLLDYAYHGYQKQEAKSVPNLMSNVPYTGSADGLRAPKLQENRMGEIPRRNKPFFLSLAGSGIICI